VITCELLPCLYSLTCVFRNFPPTGTKHRGSSDGDKTEGAKLKNVEMTEHGGAYHMGSVKMEDDGETKGETKGDEKANAV
jgi:hypothetical protein